MKQEINRQKQKNIKNKKDNKEPLVKIIPLGGTGNVTKNMFVYETANDIIIVDCGMGFPDEGMLGVDLVIPDINYLLNKKRKIKGIVITHGHEDHIGALPYVLPEIDVPVYGSKLTIGLIRAKLKEYKLDQSARLQVVNMNQRLQLGDFNLSFFRVCHSIQDSMGIILKTPIGNIIHAADYKFDWTPVDGKTFEVEKLAQLTTQGGVKILLTDCLRIEKKGYTLSEQAIEDSFEEVINKASGRVLITTFSSNISRIQQAINVAQRHSRRVALVGRSVEQNVQVAQKLGYLNIPPGLIVPVKKTKGVLDENLLLIVAGSQGQSGSALARIANKDHRLVKIKNGDVVIFASDPIPGNADAVYNIIDRLTGLGATVIYSEITDDIHVSGHAAREELALMLGLTKPEYVVPIGGLLRHQKQMALLAREMGLPESNTLVLEEGREIEIRKSGVRLGNIVPVSDVLVDGTGIGDVGNVVLRDRQVLSSEGVFVVIVSLTKDTNELIKPPEIVSRGFVYMKESETLIEASQKIVKKVVSEGVKKDRDLGYIRRKIIDELEKFLFKQTERRPMILPVIVEV